MKKTVEYSYPSSTNANKLGFSKTGCYTVELVDKNWKTTIVAGYVKKEDAVNHAERLPNEWHPLYIKYNQ